MLCQNICLYNETMGMLTMFLAFINPSITVNTWVCTQQFSYWCLSAKTPGHWYPQCWLNINCIGPVLWKNITVIRNHKRNRIHVKQTKKTVVEHIPPSCHIYLSVNWVSIGSDNGLLPVKHQAFTWTNADSLSTGTLGTHFSEIWTQIQNFPFTKMRLKMLFAKWWSFCSGRYELTHWGLVTPFGDIDLGQHWLR